GREVVSSAEGAALPQSAYLSPDGRRVAIASIGSLRILEVASKKPVAAWSLNFQHGVYHLAFSADGRRLAGASLDGGVRVWDIKSEKLLHTFRHSDRLGCVAFHPNAKHLVSRS